MVHVKSWQQAYVGLVPQSYLDGLEVSKRADNWRRVLADDRNSALLHFVDGSPAGFVAIGPCRDDDAAGDWGEVGALYYLQQHWGRGHSTELLRSAIGRLRSEGFRMITLWVLDRNARAISFYRKDVDEAAHGDQ